MSHYEKLQYGFMMATITMGLMMVIGGIFQIAGISDFFNNFYIAYVVPFLVGGYLFAPLINKFIKLK